MRTTVPHLIVVIPGIGGSALSRDGEDLWKLSLPVAIRALVSRGRSIEELLPDDPTLLDDPEFNDGIVPSGLIDAPLTLPGLARFGGYSALRDALHSSFDLDDLNYLEFAYDWRRDIRFAAQQLADAIDERLRDYDAYVGRAEVIVIAHSMGGLVARWWLDQLGGSERCRGLITLGTPFRGAPKAIRMLAGGYVWKSTGSRRFAELLRALPSVHQLLPLYPCIHDRRGDAYELRRVTEMDGALPGIDQRRAGDARALLETINKSPSPALTSVIGGTGQPTLQSVTVGDSGLSYPSAALPPDFGRSAESDGDATVPWISARPLDLSSVRGLSPAFANQSHGGLSREQGHLDGVVARVAHLLVDDDPARSPFPDQRVSPTAQGDDRPRLGLRIAEDYVEGEPVELGIVASGYPDGTKVNVEIGLERRTELLDGSDRHIEIAPLPAGSHPIRAWPTLPGGGAGSTVVVDTVDVWPA